MNISLQYFSVRSILRVWVCVRVRVCASVCPIVCAAHWAVRCLHINTAHLRPDVAEQTVELVIVCVQYSFVIL